MEIDEKIIKETIHCKRGHECVNADNEFFKLNGKLERLLEGKIHIVHCNDAICHYRLNFGKYVICNCPTRKEILRIRKRN
ncbi:MAG: hypothetical protein P4L34_01230 [Paludibacter sp.]|nr:hypothetical protein [Paludibacter sp.]